MEHRNRNIWIIVIAVAALLLVCCLVIAGVAIAVLGANFAFDAPGTMGRVTEQIETVYTVDPDAALDVNNFAGDIVVRSGQTGQIRVLATKYARNSSDLNRMEVEITEAEGGVRIRTSHAGGMGTNQSVRIEVVVPPDAPLDLVTGAGNIQVDDVAGEISSRTGAGNVEVRGATAPVALKTGAGDIDYTGDPIGLCTFETGAGSITLRLPADLDAEVSLHTGIGNIRLGGFEVEGDTREMRVDGIIGTGDQATLEADTKVGDIILSQR